MSDLLPVFIGVALLLAACSAEPPETSIDSTDLVEAAAWAPVLPDDSPFAAMAPPDATCAPGSVAVEEGLLEIQTTDCDAVTLEQPLRLDVPAEAELTWLFWHLALRSDEPEVVGDVRLAVDGEVLWSLTVPIPADATTYDEVLVAPRALAAGAPVHLHLQNHGANSWRVGAFRLR